MKKTVVVTGLGPVSSAGLGHKTFWKNILEGKRFFSKTTRFDTTDLDCGIGSEIQNFHATDFVSAKEARRMDRVSLYALAASLMAFEDSGLSMKKINSSRMGVMVGSAAGGMESLQQSVRAFHQKGLKRVSPTSLPMVLPGMIGSQIAMAIGSHGPCEVVSSACASASIAMGRALRLIQQGEIDYALAGGADACIHFWAYAGFGLMKALSTETDPMLASRPFDLKRNGFVMGEGAGMLLLESLESAQKRNAFIYAELAGMGSSADAFHITAPTASGEWNAKAMQLAMADAQITPEQIDYISAHGTSTVYNDLYETRAIKLALGERASRVPISAVKSMIGHTQGASGALSAIVCVLSLRDQKIHPTVNLDNPDPECDLDYVPHFYREHKIDYALSNALGFGGINAALVLKKAEYQGASSQK